MRTPRRLRIASLASAAGLLASLGLFSLGCSPGSPQDDAGPDPQPADPCARALDEVESGVELLRFEGGEPYVSVHIEREYVGGGVGESSVYELKSFALGRGDECLDTRDPAALSYESSHHNWADRASALLDGVRYTAAIDYQFGGGGWQVTLTGENEADGAQVLEQPGLVVTGGPLACWTCPGALPVWITEVLPENDGAKRDEAGDADPWLELYNPSSDAVSLQGWTLELSGSASGTFTFPAGATIPRHGQLLVWLDGEPEEGELHASFALPTTGGRVGLRDRSGMGVGERTFSSPGRGKSLDLDVAARAFVVSDVPTPGGLSPLQQ